MKPTSIFAQVMALSILVLAVALAIGATLALALPAPDRGRINIREMAWALERKPSSVIGVQVHNLPPEGRRSVLVEEALATALGRSLKDVRVVWRDEPGAAEGRGQNIILIDGRDVLVSSEASGFNLTYGPDAALSDDTFVPLFIGAVRAPSGRWLVGVPHDPVHEEWRRRILLAFGLAGLLLAPLVWSVARRVSRPVEALARSAEAAHLEGSDPFPVSGPLEVQKAASAINAMHGRLAAQAEERMQMMAALAHDLRTPLTALHLRLTAVSPKLRDRLQPDLDRMAALIEDSLALARLEAMTVERSSIDLEAFVRAAQLERLERRQEVRLGGLASVVVSTDEPLLRRALDNLVDNALRYGSLAIVSVEPKHGGGALLRVEDHGPGIPDGELARLLRPFEVLDPARSKVQGGAGLGLSIVVDIARKLDLGLTLKNGPKGLVVEVTFSATD